MPTSNPPIIFLSVFVQAFHNWPWHNLPGTVCTRCGPWPRLSKPHSGLKLRIFPWRWVFTQVLSWEECCEGTMHDYNYLGIPWTRCLVWRAQGKVRVFKWQKKSGCLKPANPNRSSPVKILFSPKAKDRCERIFWRFYNCKVAVPYTQVRREHPMLRQMQRRWRMNPMNDD